MKLIHTNNNFLLAAFTTGCFFISACENPDAEIKKATAKRMGIEEAKEVSINYTIGGKIKARLTAPVMFRYQDTVPYLEFPKTLHADFYDNNLQVESRLDAHYAKYMETENKVFLKDSVRVINNKGDTLYSQELYWDRSQLGKEFYTDKPVRIRTKTHIIDGTGLDAPQDFHDWHIVEPHGFVKVPASEFPG
ncbi:MAG: LPS export ABC transporter periplasmic protein LptC [Ginsengibacter sp.]